MQRLLNGGHATGNLVHDAHVAALVMEHGVTELWTADRDFAHFPEFTYETRSLHGTDGTSCISSKTLFSAHRQRR